VVCVAPITVPSSPPKESAAVPPPASVSFHQWVRAVHPGSVVVDVELVDVVDVEEVLVVDVLVVDVLLVLVDVVVVVPVVVVPVVVVDVLLVDVDDVLLVEVLVEEVLLVLEVDVDEVEEVLLVLLVLLVEVLLVLVVEVEVVVVVATLVSHMLSQSVLSTPLKPVLVLVSSKQRAPERTASLKVLTVSVHVVASVAVSKMSSMDSLTSILLMIVPTLTYRAAPLSKSYPNTILLDFIFTLSVCVRSKTLYLVSVWKVYRSVAFPLEAMV